MNYYVDSSVLLRVILEQKEQIPLNFAKGQFVTSDLTWVECMRSIDRNRITLKMTDWQIAKLIDRTNDIFHNISKINLSRDILLDAGKPCMTSLGTLDAIHLHSALRFQTTLKQDIVFLTHDKELGIACKTMGIEVLGI